MGNRRSALFFVIIAIHIFSLQVAYSADTNTSAQTVPTYWEKQVRKILPSNWIIVSVSTNSHPTQIADLKQLPGGGVEIVLKGPKAHQWATLKNPGYESLVLWFMPVDYQRSRQQEDPEGKAQRIPPRYVGENNETKVYADDELSKRPTWPNWQNAIIKQFRLVGKAD